MSSMEFPIEVIPGKTQIFKYDLDKVNRDPQEKLELGMARVAFNFGPEWKTLRDRSIEDPDLYLVLKAYAELDAINEPHLALSMITWFLSEKLSSDDIHPKQKIAINQAVDDLVYARKKIIESPEDYPNTMKVYQRAKDYIKS